ncbi:hypothetical protein KM800_13395 [Clostridium tyrobutyricum]|uniref:hypothetical protein n=1 Tax=Clostridium tyrobutyricum TaxID=1519 RepID=UPI001C38BB21|nr:hypothetical protein [Clostridium tyrobutyricum]MBV4420300.1 hypothetical protein [Clostridium tyrobutyricum]
MIKKIKEMMIPKNPKIYKLCFTVFLCLLIPFIIVRYNINLNDVKVLGDDFLITLITGLLSLSVATIALLYPTINSIKQSFKEFPKQKEALLNKLLNNCIKEIKDDTFLIFKFLVFVILISIFYSMDIPNITWNIKIISKSQIYWYSKLSSLNLCVLAIYDVIKTIFIILTAEYTKY